MKLISTLAICLVCLVSSVSSAESIADAVEGKWARKVEFLGEIFTVVKSLKDGHETVDVYDAQGNEQGYEEMVAGLDGLNVNTAESTDRRFRSLGETVLETGVFTASGTIRSESFSWKHRYCDVWVRKGDRWVVTHEQLTPITPDSVSE